MYANPVDLLKAFLSNDTTVQKEAERNQIKLAQENPNASIELYTSCLDYQESAVNFYFCTNLMCADSGISCSLY